MAARFGFYIVLLLLSAGSNAWAQIPTIPTPGPAQAEAPQVPRDPLDRTTPRGTVRGFLKACSKRDWQTATLYLDAGRNEEAGELADQLFFILNRSLRVQLNDISDRPEGSLSYSTEPYKDLIGRISSDEGDVDIIVERINRKDIGAIWLFSRKTLDAVPELYAELSVETEQPKFLKFLLEKRISHIALLHWVVIFIGLPLLYFLGVGLNRLSSPLAGKLIRAVRKNPNLPNPLILSNPVQLIVTAVLIRFTLLKLPLSLLGREFWSGVAAITTVAGFVWLLIRAASGLEARMRVRLGRRNSAGVLSVLRLARWGIDIVVVFAGAFVLIHYFNINGTTAVAGLGIGGIAIALAAQKSLENIIAGISLISDKALRIGDFLRIGPILGTVTDIGLRSTTIRTLERTVVNMPNGQIAIATVENLSLRDRFWFHHILAITYEASASQLRALLAGIVDLLANQPATDKDTRHDMRLLRFGTSSFELEIFAYVFARDFSDFLKIQEALLLDVMDIVEKVGARIAVPAQITYLNTDLLSAADVNRQSQELVQRSARVGKTIQSH